MADQHVLVSNKNGVRTLTMNRPQQLNGWTPAMMDAIKEAFKAAAADSSVKAVIFTGSGRYFSAGASFSGVLKPCLPAKLHAILREANHTIFETFVKFPKPLLAAVNGPAIGGGVTSATLCDAVMAVDTATFYTPFKRLGIPPEGCSTHHWPKILSPDSLHKLHDQGLVVTAAEAKLMNLITEVVSSDQLAEAAQSLCERWIAEGKQRWLVERGLVDEYEQVNLRESKDLADAIFGSRFMIAQTQFFWSKKKYGISLMFLLMLLACPLLTFLLHVSDRTAYALLSAFALLIVSLVLFALC